MADTDRVYKDAKEKWKEGWGKVDSAQQKADSTIQEWQEWAMDQYDYQIDKT